MELKVISFNIRCANDPDGHSIAERAPRLHKVISEYDPDVIGVQEFRDAWQEQFDKYFLDKYDFYRVPRDEMPGGESVPILWKKDSFECWRRGTFWLSDTPEEMSGGWDEKYHKNRICSYVVLFDKKTRELFTVMNTHFGFGDKGQVASAKLIYDYSQRISGCPTFVTGDFNMNPDSAGYSEMVKHFIDVNAVTSKEMRTTYHGYDPEKHPNSHIDFCFIDEKVKPLSHKIITDTVDGKYPSDHYGLFIELDITDSVKIKNVLCPVCHKYTFKEENEQCPVCNWTHWFYQEIFPYERKMDNIMSLLEAREAYAKGEEIY